MQTWRWFVSVLLPLALSGCATGIHGAPPPPFDIGKIEKSTQFVDPTKTFERLATETDKTRRNDLMSPILALIDIRYARFRQELASSKKNSSAVSSTLLLAADIAGGLADSVGAKDNYLAFSALLSGGEQIYDKNYMYDQTVSALVAKMDANRSAKLLEIRSAMKSQDTDQYPGQVAIADLIEYHYAGTLLGAIAAVQRDAGAETKQNSEKLRVLGVATAQEIADSENATARLDAMIVGLKDAQKRGLAGFLSGQGVPVAQSASVADLKRGVRTLRSSKYPRNPQDMIKALEQAGFTIPQSQ